MAVLLTGANGFLGNYISSAFTEKDITTLGLTSCDYNVDLSNTIPEFSEPFKKVVHAAGLAHKIPGSKQAKELFLNINVTGTTNLLKGLEKVPPLPETFVFISTVAVYGADIGENINETSPLNGNSPYALSKIKAENLLQEWGIENKVNVLIFRLPLIVGTNPPGNLGSMIRGIRKGFYFRIGEGSARRSLVLAEDVSDLITRCHNCSGIYNLTDGVHPSIRELDEAIASKYGKRIKVLSQSLVKFISRVGDHLPFIPINTMKLIKLTSTLTFSDTQARKEIGWSSRPVIENLKAF